MAGSTMIRIGGIKFSEELVHISVTCPSQGKPSFGDLLHLLAARHINIPFICHARKGTHTASSLCIFKDDLGGFREVLQGTPLPDADIRMVQSVGTLTLFPHRNSFRLLGLVLGTLARHGLPIHSLSTSISAIAVNTSFHLLDSAAGHLAEVVVLPDNHAPFRQEFRFTQLS